MFKTHCSKCNGDTAVELPAQLCHGRLHSELSCTQVLASLGQASSGGTNPAALRQSVPQDTVTGLFRDLRGIAIATNSRRTYGAGANDRRTLMQLHMSGQDAH